MKFLRRTNDILLIYEGEKDLTVRGYADASFVIHSDDFKSQSGYAFTLNGGVVRWKSSK
jgi:hypothetical protein